MMSYLINLCLIFTTTSLLLPSLLANIIQVLSDNKLKANKHNESFDGISWTTPMPSVTKINASIEQKSNKSWPKLAANGEWDERANESYKSINTFGLFNENIASNKPKVTSNTFMTTLASMISTENYLNVNQMKYSDNSSVDVIDIINNNENISESNTTGILSFSNKSITKGSIGLTILYSASNISTDTSVYLNTTKQIALKSTNTILPPLDISDGNDTQLPTLVAQVDSTTTVTTITSTTITMPGGPQYYWTVDNTTDLTANGTANSLLSMNSSDDSIESSQRTSLLGSMVTKNSLTLPTTTITIDSKIHYNYSEQYIEVQYDDNESIQEDKRHCILQQYNGINWTSSETGILSSQLCPQPYSGTLYRPCYPSGSWGEPDYSDCRLEQLKEIQSLILYHVHKHLVDGLYPLAEDLSRLVTSGRFPLRSPMDRLDAIDSLNAILRAKIKIRMEDEDKNVNLIQSLTTICDQVLTQTPVVFTIETEKNSLITQKTAEALFGFRVLSENILRALIVVCDDGTIRRIKPIVPFANNIIMTLTHRTPFGSLIPLVQPSNYTTLINNTIIPKVIIHLEDFNKLGVGISSVWIRDMGSVLDNALYEVISDVVLVSVVPAVSIEVDFEETPKVEVELHFKRPVRQCDHISCGRIKSSRDLWQRKGCETIARNLSSIHCVCDELGIIAALIHKTSLTDSMANNSGHNHSLLVHTIVLYLSFSVSLILLLISLFCQIVQRSRESYEASFILISLVSSLMAIQLMFLSGAPFAPKWTHSHQLCSIAPLIFHFLHLVSAFWMLSHTIFLYQRLWKPLSRTSSTSLPFSESHQSIKRSVKCWSKWSSLPTSWIFNQQWDCKQFTLFSTALPALSVLISYYLNPEGYETKRYCWMSIEGGMQYSFIVPVSTLILTNTAIMLLVLKRFFETKPLTHKREIDKTQPALRAGVTLLPLFAVNWFLSVLALEDTYTTSFQCIFGASNLVLSYMVFLFHCYQRYDLNEYIRVRLFGAKHKQKSTLRLKKNTPGCGLRVDIPRLCIGDDPDVISVPNSANSGTSIDCQPLLMPYTGASQTSNIHYKQKELIQ
ncbi:adhesion G protein-coupled receptor B3-like [Oppia nitens]|uniref:adhesion G protein-coupled receptor B3-like n=1 Tax=Oppia nitens TaxID=1686743 RepID=UPI0023DACB24|nr:adhesion G protein-coupled receptor B3-like [Oppia nitens]